MSLMNVKAFLTLLLNGNVMNISRFLTILWFITWGDWVPNVLIQWSSLLSLSYLFLWVLHWSGICSTGYSLQPRGKYYQIMAWCLQHEAIIWTNVDLLSIRFQATYFNDVLFEIQKFSLKKIHFEMSSAKWVPFCLGTNELTWHSHDFVY